MPTRFMSYLALGSSLSCCLPAQQIWRVECAGGPGVDFTDLPQAVAAASPGDEIWVYRDYSHPCPGWVGYTAPNIDKPLRIVGFSSNPWLPGVNMRGLVTVTAIPAGSCVILSNLLFAHGGTLTIDPIGIEATNCLGDVIIEGALLQSSGIVGATMQFQSCANVILRGCMFHISGAPVSAVDSSVLVTNTLINHEAPWFPGTMFSPTQTAEGLRLTNSTATIITSLVWGSGVINLPPLSQWQARSAVMLDNSTLEVGPGTFLIVGPFSPIFGNPDSYRTFGSGIATVYQDPRAFIDHVPYITNGPPPIPRDLHATMHNQIGANASFDLIVAGPPAGYAVLAVGNYSSPPLPTSLGPLWLDPATITVIGCNLLDPVQGLHNSTLFCPAGVPVGYAFALQSVVLAPNGTMSLTIPSPVVVGWQLGLAP